MPSYICISNFKPHKGKLYFADHSCIETLGTGTLGDLPVIKTSNIHQILLSSSKLAKLYDFISVFDDERALVLDKNLLARNKDAVVLSATLHHDGLYHLDPFIDISQLHLTPRVLPNTNRVHKLNISEIFRNLKLNNQSIVNTNLATTSHTPLTLHESQLANIHFYNEYTTREKVQGTAYNKRRSLSVGLNPLEVLHVKLAHAPVNIIRQIIGTDKRPPSVLGLGYTHNDIKNCELPICDACMRGKMKAFTIPPSISNHVYEPFEFITCDLIPFSITTIRGYNHSCSQTKLQECYFLIS